jgi:xanthine dehydrogenase accessory factor
MIAVLKALDAAFQRGEDTVLVVITESRGSSPRKRGAVMLCGANGRICGTIGGGISEHLACEEAKKVLCTGCSAIKDYLLHPASDADIGAQCGGEVRVYLRFFSAHDAQSARVISAACALSGEAARFFSLEITETAGPPPPELLTAAPDGTSSSCIVLPLVPAGIVYIAGGGHIAVELCPLLTRLDFRCVIIEERSAFAIPERFPEALRVVHICYAELAAFITGFDYIVAVTSGHHGDFEVLNAALKTEARYIGVIGSTQKLAFVKNRLLEIGVDSACLNAPRIHAPIGLNIHSETPVEVAVSIAAELVKVRAETSLRL